MFKLCAKIEDVEVELDEVIVVVVDDELEVVPDVCSEDSLGRDSSLEHIDIRKEAKIEKNIKTFFILNNIMSVIYNLFREVLSWSN